MSSPTIPPITMPSGQKANLPTVSWARVGYYSLLTSAVVVLYVYSSARIIDLSIADLGRHIKNGELIVHTGAIPRTNLFSYTHPDTPFVNHHWATGVVYYFVHSWAGFEGLRLLNVALELGAVGLLFGLAWRWTRFELAVLAAVLAEPLIGSRYEVRPEFFSYLFMALFFVSLWQYRQEKLSGRWLWALPALVALWVNLHIFFPLGPMFVGIFLVDELFPRMRGLAERRWPRVRLLIALLLSCCAAMLINPWGFEGAAYPFMILRSYGYEIIENFPTWRNVAFAPEWVHFLIVFALTVLGASLTIFAPEGRDRQLAVLLATLAVSLLAWRFIRGIGVFGYFVVAILPLLWNRSWVLHFVDALKKRHAVLLLCGLAVVYFAIYPQPWMVRQSPGLGLRDGGLDGLNFIRDNKLHGPIFNTYNIGNYLIFGLYPDERVFVDGRPEAYPPYFFEDRLLPLMMTVENAEHWRTLMAKYDFNVLVLHADEVEGIPGFTALYWRLTGDPQWATVFLDQRMVILLRRTPENKSVIDRFEVNHAK